MDAVLKRRLMVAVVVWILALIFLPMLLKQGQSTQPAQATSTQLGLPEMPAMPEEHREVRSLDLVQKPAEPTAQVAQNTAQPAAKAGSPASSTQPETPAPTQTAPAPSQPVSTQVAKTPSQPAPALKADKPKSESVKPKSGTPNAPVKAATTDKPAATGKWVIQVGSFSDKGNAETLARRLRARNYPVLMSRIALHDRNWYRVQVGPLRSRADADAKQTRLQAQLGLNGKVVALP